MKMRSTAKHLSSKAGVELHVAKQTKHGPARNCIEVGCLFPD